MEDSLTPLSMLTSPTTVPADSAVVLRREDLAASIAGSRAAVRAALRGRLSWLFFVGMMLVAPVSVALVYVFRWATLPDWLSLVAGLALGGVLLLTLIRMHLARCQRIVQQYQLRCPSCAHELLDTWIFSGHASVVDLTVQTGRCPYCGEVSFAA